MAEIVWICNACTEWTNLAREKGRADCRHIVMLESEAAGTDREDDMPESIYDVIVLVGSSKESWEKAAANAVAQASKTLRDVRVAEVAELDMQLDATGKVEAYRAKVKLSFKVEA